MSFLYLAALSVNLAVFWAHSQVLTHHLPVKKHGHHAVKALTLILPVGGGAVGGGAGALEQILSLLQHSLTPTPA